MGNIRLRSTSTRLALAGVALLAAGCSSDKAPADGGGGDGSGARQCVTDGFFCSDSVVSREVADGKGGCTREKVYSCRDGCKVFSATTTRAALLCKEGFLDAAPPPADSAAPAADTAAPASDTATPVEDGAAVDTAAAG